VLSRHIASSPLSRKVWWPSGRYLVVLVPGRHSFPSSINLAIKSARSQVRSPRHQVAISSIMRHFIWLTCQLVIMLFHQFNVRSPSHHIAISTSGCLIVLLSRVSFFFAIKASRHQDAIKSSCSLVILLSCLVINYRSFHLAIRSPRCLGITTAHSFSTQHIDITPSRQCPALSLHLLAIIFLIIILEQQWIALSTHDTFTLRLLAMSTTHNHTHYSRHRSPFSHQINQHFSNNARFFLSLRRYCDVVILTVQQLDTNQREIKLSHLSKIDYWWSIAEYTVS
jgi:hypothetical protein